MKTEQRLIREEFEINLVSIVVSCHNDEDTIGRCLDAISSMKLPDTVTMKVIVADVSAL